MIRRRFSASKILNESVEYSTIALTLSHIFLQLEVTCQICKYMLILSSFQLDTPLIFDKYYPIKVNETENVKKSTM